MSKTGPSAVKLRCRQCGYEQSIAPTFTGCAICAASGHDGVLEADYDYHYFARTDLLKAWAERSGVWGYRELLPLPSKEAPVSLLEGGTPLIRIESAGPGRVWIKDETRNPTGAHKDRFHSVSVSMARHLGFKKVTASTTGNHGLSLAAYAAKASMDCLVFCDLRSPQILRVAMQVFGARVATIEGREQHLEWLVRERGWYPSTSMTPIPVGTPYGVEGYKTIAYEIFFGLGARMPRRVIIPVASGDILYGPWKGFKELQRLGALGKLPTIHAIQAEGCDPIVRGFKAQAHKVPVHPDPQTIAISISDRTAAPVTLETIYESLGTAEAVSDARIVTAMRSLARHGVIAEPAGASAVAAAYDMQSRGAIAENEDIVCIVTGGGMKWPEQLPLAANHHAIQESDPVSVRAWIEAFDARPLVGL